MDGIDHGLCRLRLPSPVDLMSFDADVGEDLLAADARFVLVYRPAAQALQATLQDGGSLQEGLENWRAEISPLLTLARRARRAALIVEEQTLLRGDAALLAPLAQHLDGAELPPALPAAEEDGSVFMLLAERAVGVSPDIAALDLEAEARALPRTEVTATLAQIDRMVTDYRGTQESALLATRQVTELTAQLDDSRTAQEEAQAAARTAQAEHDRQLARAREDHQALEQARDQALALADQQIRELMEQAEADHQSLQQAQKHAETLLADLAKQAEDTQQAQAEQARAHAEALQDAQTEAEARLRVLTEQAEQAEGRQATLLQSLKKAEQTLAERDRELSEAQAALQEGIGGAEEKADALSGACELMRAQISELQAELATQVERGATARKALADRQTQVDRQIKALDEATLRSAALTRQLREQAQEHQLRQDEMLRQIHAAQSEIETARNRATLSEEQMMELSAETAALTAQRAHQSARADKLSEELEAARQHWDDILTQAEQREQSLRQGLEDLTEAYSRLMESRSWKITEPLRAANKLLHRMNRTR
jgi:chromosome segregation ATPase